MREAILLKNISPVMLQVQPAANSGTSIDQPVGSSDDFRDLVNIEIATKTKNSTATVRFIPAGGYTVARAPEGYRAAVTVNVPQRAAYAAYAADVMARYIEAKVTAPPQALAKSAAECAEQAAEVWAETRPPANMDLDQLLAQTALGPASSCGKVVNEVNEQIHKPPPSKPAVLADEFKDFKKSVTASVLDDLVKWVRELVRIR